jgi:putative membrane protein
MTRAAYLLLLAGVALFVAVLVSQGVPAILAALSLAGWGLLLVALFHVVPLVLDAAAIRVLFESGAARGSMRHALLARWVGESANSLMPAGQIGGPLLMARHLTTLGLRVHDAAAVIIVSTTLQTVGQILFALMGVMLLGAQAGHLSEHALRTASLIASGVLAVQVAGFYLLQRRGLFSKIMRAGVRFAGKRDWSRWVSHAQSIDLSIEATYGRAGPVAASFLLSFIGWLVGAGEVFLILELLNAPVTWVNALLLESLGQAIRGAAFAVPGALGVQEGGYLLLAPLAGLPPDMALALSLAKRAREIILGLPGLLYLRLSRSGAAAAAGSEAQ